MGIDPSFSGLVFGPSFSWFVVGPPFLLRAFLSPGGKWALLGVGVGTCFPLGLGGSYGGVAPSLSGWDLAFPSWSEAWPFLLAVWFLPVFLVVVVASSYWLLGLRPSFFWGGGLVLPSRVVVVGHSKKKKEYVKTCRKKMK